MRCIIFLLAVEIDCKAQLFLNAVFKILEVICACSLKDRAVASGATCAGSIPARRIVFVVFMLIIIYY